jgi:hypothetical protein
LYLPKFFLFNKHFFSSFIFGGYREDVFSFKNYYFKDVMRLNSNSNIANSIIPIIELWNTELNYIVVVRILRSFNLTNKYYLKGIFFKFIKDLILWNQVNKMLTMNKIGISGNLIYNSINNLCNSNLSAFLLNLYLIEFDIYFEKIIFKYNFSKNFNYNIKKYSDKFFTYIKFLKRFTPLKSGKILVEFSQFKVLFSSKYNRFYNNFMNNYKVTCNSSLYIFYSRYLDFIIMGFISSQTFVFFLLKKLQNFLRFKINFSVKQLGVFNSKHKDVTYLFYKIDIMNCSFKLKSNNLLNNKFYFSKIFFRILNYQRKFSDILIKRFRLEFKSNLKYIFDNKKNFSHLAKNISILLFQLESVASIQVHTLVDRSLIRNFLSNNILSEVRLSSNRVYSKYLFNLYALKSRVMFKDTLETITPYFLYGSFPNDFFLQNSLLELKKNVLLKNTIYSNNYFFFLTKRYFFSHLYIFDINVYTKNTRVFEKELVNYNTFLKKFYVNKSFVLLIPFNLLIKKLRLLGFIHSFKNYPTSNLSLIFFSDSFIIRSASYIVYCLLSWFRLCDDFFKLKFFIRLIQESCLLTLCRKHNKSRVWVYNLYTFDLIIFKKLYYDKVFFPSVKFTKKLQARRSFLQDKYKLDESFLF